MVSAGKGEGLGELREMILRKAPEDFLSSDKMLGDLVPAGSAVMLITPIDIEAPKGRMILPQVQAIRDTLDHDCYCLVVKENSLADALANMKTPPTRRRSDRCPRLCLRRFR